MSQDPFRALRQEYLEGARLRLKELPALAEAAARDGASLLELRRLAHNLRGSGGFYGFQEITQAAEALEELAINGLGGEDLPQGALVAAAQALVEAVHSSKLP